MSPTSRFQWSGPAIIVVSTIAAYHNTLSVPLIFDDASSILHNPSIRSFRPLGSLLSPPSECTVAGRPLANILFALNYALGGTSVQGYHVLNLGLHLAAALLLFGVIRRTLLMVQKGSTAAATSGLFKFPEWVAVAIATLWAVHPLSTSSVTYLSQRTEVLMTACYLGTLYAFIRAVTASSRGWYGVAIAACFLGVASKEGMVTAPVLVLLYDRAFIAKTFRRALETRWWFYLLLASSWGLLAVLMSGLKDRAVGYELGVTWWTYALTECQAILLYMRLIVWPNPLIFDYGVRFVPDLSAAWPYVLGLGTVLTATVVALVRWPRVGFLAGAFFIILSPTSSVVPIATQPIAENRVYLASAAMLALLGVGGSSLLSRNRAYVVGAIGLGLVSLSIARNAIFQDKVRLWRDTAAKRPMNPRAHEILGETLHEVGRYLEAKAQFETAVKLKPDYFEAYNNLGTTLNALGDAQGAAKSFETAIRLKPDYPTPHNNLGNLLLKFGQVERARYHCEEALRLYSQPNRLKPDLAETHNNLGNAMLYQGDVAGAAGHYREALRLKPEFLQARMNLGVVSRLLGAFAEAGEHLQRVVQAKPDFPEAWFNLGVLLQQIGKSEEATDAFQRALRYQPDFAEALLSLGQLHLAKGELNQAKTYLERVLKLRPDNQAAREAMTEISQREKVQAPAPPPLR